MAEKPTGSERSIIEDNEEEEALAEKKKLQEDTLPIDIGL